MMKIEFKMDTICMRLIILNTIDDDVADDVGKMCLAVDWMIRWIWAYQENYI
jgi:hypothetical protein